MGVAGVVHRGSPYLGYPRKELTVFLRRKKLDLPTPEEALPGRDTPMPVPGRHTVLGMPLTGPWPAGYQVAIFGFNILEFRNVIDIHNIRRSCQTHVEQGDKALTACQHLNILTILVK